MRRARTSSRSALRATGLAEPAPAQTVAIYGSGTAAGDGYRGASLEFTVLEAAGDFRLDLGACYDRGTRGAVLYPESSSGAVTARASRSLAGPLRQWFAAHLADGHRDPSEAYRTYRPWNVGGRTPRLRLGTGVDFAPEGGGGLFIRLGLQWERGTAWTERERLTPHSPVPELDARRESGDDLAVALLKLLDLVEHARRENPGMRGSEFLPRGGPDAGPAGGGDGAAGASTACAEPPRRGGTERRRVYSRPRSARPRSSPRGGSHLGSCLGPRLGRRTGGGGFDESVSPQAGGPRQLAATRAPQAVREPVPQLPA